MAQADPQSTTPASPPKRPRLSIDEKTRRRIERAAERMIAFLDAIDAREEELEDNEREADPDFEPSIGTPAAGDNEQLSWGYTNSDERGGRLRRSRARCRRRA
jgi:hypothetical protein